MPGEPRRLLQRELQLHAAAAPSAARVDNSDLQDEHGGEADQQRAQPTFEALDQDVVDEGLVAPGRTSPGITIIRLSQADDGRAHMAARQAVRSWANRPTDAPPGLNSGPGEQRSRSTPVKPGPNSSRVTRRGAGRRIVQEDHAVRGAFEHEEMVEAPRTDDRKGTGQDLVELETMALGVEAVRRSAARTMLGGLAAVARDAAMATRSSSMRCAVGRNGRG